MRRSVTNDLRHLSGRAPSTRLACMGGALAIGVQMAGPAAADEALIERGEYLAIAADCAGCHTRDGGEPFAGGLAIESPLGTLYTSNITPDPEHGIGEWSKQDFDGALRQGRDHEGQYLYPAMPYTSYTKISDEDIDALWAWQQSLEPSSEQPPEHDMSFPANIRQGLALWQAVEFDAGRFEAVEGEDDEYNRGAYLVEALGHCSACHTPRNILFGKDESRRYTGAEIHGWYAPAIGPGKLSSIADWSVDELATFLSTGRDKDNQKAVGQMAEVVHTSLSKLDQSDVRAMARYLKEMPVADEQPEAEAVDPLTAQRSEAGRAIYAANCLGCHQSNGQGIDGGVPTLVDSSSVVGLEPNTLIMMMLEGHALEEESWAAMPSFANVLSSRDMADVANYVRTAWTNEAEPNVTPELVNELRQLADLPETAREIAGTECPVLSGEVIEPALDVTPAQFESAQEDSTQVAALIDDYRAERADSPLSQVVLALSTAYCRQVAGEDISIAEQQSRVSAFAGRIAVVGERGTL